jgi:hypothetical protein
MTAEASELFAIVQRSPPHAASMKMAAPAVAVMSPAGARMPRDTTGSPYTSPETEDVASEVSFGGALLNSSGRHTLSQAGSEHSLRHMAESNDLNANQPQGARTTLSSFGGHTISSCSSSRRSTRDDSGSSNQSLRGASRAGLSPSLSQLRQRSPSADHSPMLSLLPPAFRPPLARPIFATASPPSKASHLPPRQPPAAQEAATPPASCTTGVQADVQASAGHAAAAACTSLHLMKHLSISSKWAGEVASASGVLVSQSSAPAAVDISLSPPVPQDAVPVEAVLADQPWPEAWHSLYTQGASVPDVQLAPTPAMS